MNPTSSPPNQTGVLIPDINGQVIRHTREGRHLTQEQLARILCLSRKHVDQLENGGISAFFSLKHRYQVALKVADYLGLAPVDIWVEKLQQADVPNSFETPAKQVQTLVDQVETAIVAEPVSTVLPSKVQNGFAQHISKLVYVALLAVLVPTSYLIADLVIIQNNLISPTAIVAIPNELDKKIAASDVPAINPVDMCDLTQFASIPAVSVELPLKKGDSLLMVAKSFQPVCVIDGVKKVSTLNLNTEAKQFIVGQSPFTINARDFNGLEIYFQGRQVRYPANWQGPIRLIEGTFKEAVN